MDLTRLIRLGALALVVVGLGFALGLRAFGWGLVGLGALALGDHVLVELAALKQRDGGGDGRAA